MTHNQKKCMIIERKMKNKNVESVGSLNHFVVLLFKTWVTADNASTVVIERPLVHKSESDQQKDKRIVFYA